ncbi:MAG: hybrid sensor histidine kinase/response regulator [Anaerolineae bacterium]|nr:hybrid sensor histidine kinase/response regulator [Anaerolineae bacterium]
MMEERILVVDDEVDVLDLCRRILETKGYQVKTAHNGYEAIGLAQQEKFDLLLTDIKMPGMTGLQIAQALKKSDPEVICVTMTGYSTMDMVLEALKLGIDEFILKPFTPDELSMAVAKTLEKEQLRKEIFRLRSLIPLFELNKTLLGTVEVDKVLNRLLAISQKETKADLAGLYIFEKDKMTSRLQGEGEHEDDAQKQQARDQLASLISENGQQLALSLDNADNHCRSILERLEVHSLIATPLRSKESNRCALILARNEGNFAPSDSDFLTVLSGQASIALENARLFTEIQKAYKELQLLDHMKSEFINIAAHELRTPLAILIGYATVLEEETENLTHEYISIIARNAMRLRALIEDMLNLKYLESGIPSLSQDKLNLPEVITDAIQDIALLAQKKGLTVHVDVPPDLPPLIADRQKFDLIIMNLLDNALKFTPAGGQVTLKAETAAEGVKISVSDTGIGIPEDKIERVFDRFFQVQDSLTRAYEGMGLGLAIVRGMVDVCGGKIQVTSKEGEGTTFTFTLPLDNSKVEPRPLKL